jgi:hypothetical protein
MLTGGEVAGEVMTGGFGIGLGRQRRAATMMLAMWSTLVVPQSIAAATAGTVIDRSHRWFK